MAQISATATKFLYSEGITDIRVTFKVGNCKLTEKDLKTLLALQRICRKNPYTTIDCRTKQPDLLLAMIKDTRIKIADYIAAGFSRIDATSRVKHESCAGPKVWHIIEQTNKV